VSVMDKKGLIEGNLITILLWILFIIAVGAGMILLFKRISG